MIDYKTLIKTITKKTNIRGIITDTQIILSMDGANLLFVDKENTDVLSKLIKTGHISQDLDFFFELDRLENLRKLIDRENHVIYNKTNIKFEETFLNKTIVLNFLVGNNNELISVNEKYLNCFDDNTIFRAYEKNFIVCYNSNNNVIGVVTPHKMTNFNRQILPFVLSEEINYGNY